MLSQRDRRNSPGDVVPLSCWGNLISIDAVIVGVAWHFLYTGQFCQRIPAWYESTIVGLSIWLVYTADRLFDTVGLDINAPHSARHRFHLDHRRSLAASWILVLLGNAAIVAINASPAQLRFGCIAIAVVIAYVASAQWLAGLTRILPKELQAGCVFAFGTSITAWSEVGAGAFVTLLIANLLAAGLFTMNCVLIASGERLLDESQGFPSVVMTHQGCGQRLPVFVAAHGVLTLLAVIFLGVPMAVATTLLACDALLILLIRIVHRRPRGGLEPIGANVWANPIAFMTAMAILIPPAVWMMLPVSNP